MVLSSTTWIVLVLEAGLSALFPGRKLTMNPIKRYFCSGIVFNTGG